MKSIAEPSSNQVVEVGLFSPRQRDAAVRFYDGIQACAEALLRGEVETARECIRRMQQVTAVSSSRAGPSRRTKAAVFFRDNWTCRYCGTPVIVQQLLAVLSILGTGLKFDSNWKAGATDFGVVLFSAEADHVIPAARGELLDRHGILDPHVESNLATACPICNAAKGQLTPEAAQMTLRPIEVADWEGGVGLFLRLTGSGLLGHVPEELFNRKTITRQNIAEWIAAFRPFYKNSPA